MWVRILLALTLLLFTSQVFAQEVFNNCPMEGDAKKAAVRHLNRLKNRYRAPQPEDFNRDITLKAMLVPGDDDNRWKDSQAGEITGYVFEVKGGEEETCNCHAKENEYQDTHIELILDPRQTEKTKRVIVEVTPRWRKMMQDKGVDWSTAGLRQAVKGRWVKVRGWMMFDREHEHQSENINPDGHMNWRATAWEIHPITSLEVAPPPKQ
ncbi:MAG: hypothetical protein ACYDIC_14835 [Desulfobaccales bacterium]